MTHGSQFLDSDDAGLLIASLTETYRLNEKLQIQNKNLLNEKREWCCNQQSPVKTRTFIDPETGEVFRVVSSDD